MTQIEIDVEDLAKAKSKKREFGLSQLLQRKAITGNKKLAERKERGLIMKKE